MKKFRYKANRPKRADLCGLSPSEFKTKLRRAGHKIPRNFFANSCISKKGANVYRWRWWMPAEPVVDIANANDFDRWANSVLEVVSFKEILDKKGR